MDVVIHEAIGDDTGIEALAGLRDHAQQRLAVSVILKDGLAAVSARRDMINSAGKLDSWWSGHERGLPRGAAKWKT